MDNTACLRPVGTAPHQSHFVVAAQAAEFSGARQLRGQSFRCSRGLGSVTPAQCLENFLYGDRPCTSPEHGQCSTGVIEKSKHPEATMPVGECRGKNCPSKGLRVILRDGLCCDCRSEAKGQKSAQDKAPATPAVVADEPMVSGRDDANRDRHDQPTILSPDESEALVSVLERDPNVTVLTDETLPDLTPEPMEFAVGLGAVRDMVHATLDTTRPFVLAGIEFEPVRPKRPMGSCSICIRRDTIGISTAAEQQFGLQPYTHASYTVSTDGQAVALMFYGGPRDEAVTIQRNKGALSISSTPLGRAHPDLVGKRTALQPTEVPGCFIARFGGVAS